MTSISLAVDDWRLDISGDALNMECSAIDFDLSQLINDRVSGICQTIQAEADESLGITGGSILGAILTGNTGSLEDILVGALVGRFGSSFDLGGFARCETGFGDTNTTTLSSLCNHYGTAQANRVMSAVKTWMVNSVDAEGLFGGGTAQDKPVPVEERYYPSGLSAKDLYGVGKITDEDGNEYTVEGGYQYASLEDDPKGSTALAHTKFDKPTIYLKDFALKTIGTDDASAVRLPATKMESIKLVDETVAQQTRQHLDIPQFVDGLVTALRRLYTDPSKLDVGVPPDMISLAEYAKKEKEVAHNFFSDRASGLAQIYEGVENEAKAKLGSMLLLENARDDAIMDPSESRLRYIDASQHNAFRYAALIQQERNKQMKLKVSLELKRARILIDIAKRQATIRASIFRDDIARNEIDLLLEAVDQSVSY